MIKFGRAVAKSRLLILIICIALLIPSALGILNTRINYDMLDYLPDDMETVQGQNILMDEFGKGAFSFVVVEGMSDEDVSAMRQRIEQVDHVDTALWYDSLVDLSVPKELLPQKLYDAFNSGDATLIAVFFDTSTSADDTMEAISQVRSIVGKQAFVSGMSAMVTDLKALCEREEPIYVGLAVLLSCVAMMIFMDNFLTPIVFLISIGMAIVYNLGSNIFLGEISYITKALAAVLQLGVTMDYSIFLWHSYLEQSEQYSDRIEAMSHAIAATITSVAGSSLTTIAGFIAMCFMSYTMGVDLGIVMAKGVLLGVIASVTLLPSLILILDKPLRKASHKTFIRRMDGLASFVTRHFVPFLLIFVIVLVPAVIGYKNTGVYYDFSKTLSVEGGLDEADVPYSVANDKLREHFDISTTLMVLCDANLPASQASQMLDDMEQVDGVLYALGINSIVDGTIPESMIPDAALSTLKSDNYQLMLVNSEYQVSTDEVNQQIDTIKQIIKRYDPSAMLIGEAPCTKDLIEVTDHDFDVVNAISIAAIFLIILLTFKSAALPVVLVSVIEFAIFINLGLPYYTGTTLPFIAPICISTIQLGATVDYAILMTTRYKQERLAGQNRRDAVTTALAVSIPSIVVSAIGFFAATFGVSVYSNIDIISSMCGLMARGAIVSMLSVIFILPSLLMLLDRVICATTAGMRKLTKKDREVSV